MTRALGIDYGDSRVGISLSDPMRIIAKPFDEKKLLSTASWIEKLVEFNTKPSII